VIFRGDASVANRTVPFSQFDSKNPEDLWRALADFEKSTGTEVLAIPHNGNLSNGRMFSVETFDGQPLTLELTRSAILSWSQFGPIPTLIPTGALSTTRESSRFPHPAARLMKRSALASKCQMTCR
jgi:hypothetical protein